MAMKVMKVMKGMAMKKAAGKQAAKTEHRDKKFGIRQRLAEQRAFARKQAAQKTAPVTGKALNKEVKQLLHKAWADCSEDEQKDILKNLSNPGRTLYNQFHKTMAMDASIPAHFKEDG